MTDPDRLRRLLGGADLRWLVDRLRRRLEAGRPLTGMVVRDPASDAERAAVAALLGQPRRPGTAARVPLESLHEVLRRSDAAPDLASAVQALTGPVADQAAVRAAEATAWEAAYAVLDRAAADRPVLVGWVEDFRRTGLLRRLAADPGSACALAARAVEVLGLLPADGVPLSVLAARAGGGGHALDPGAPLATLVLKAAALLGDVPYGTSGEARRTIWAAVGVLAGELTAPVLVLNLPAVGDHPTDVALRGYAEAGEPAYLTSRQLLRDPPRFADAEIFGCENPAVVAEAANRLGAGSRPLICVSGYPAAAATLLLRALTVQGLRLRYHGDFDWDGMAIASGIFRGYAALPWRLDTASYLRAAGEQARQLRGNPVETPWEPALAHAMRQTGRAVEEELVIDDLLADLE
ncbi:MAG: TIGR02679 family protein [Micromonosporaceae bacterium]